MTSRLYSARSTLARQYKDTLRLQGILDTLQELTVEKLEEPAAYLKDQGTDQAQGAWLDLLARRFGLLRPYKSEGTAFFFGFDGNPQATPFNQAPFKPDGSQLEGKIPMSDVLFRQLLKSTAGSLRTDGTQDNINQILNEAYPGSWVTDGLDMTMAANLDLDLLGDDLALILQQGGRIPKPAGVNLDINIVSGPPIFFGFAGASQTVGFNQAPFKPDGA